MINIGTRLKALRIEKKFTQKQIAERLGVAISAISSYETGLAYPTYENLIKLARIYHVSTDYLLGINEKQSIYIDGLNDEAVVLVSSLIEMLREQNRKS